MKSKRFDKVKKILLTKVTQTSYFNFGTLLLGLLILYTLYSKGVLAVAFIGGEPITVPQIVGYYRQEKTGNVLERVIAQKVLAYEAKKRNITVSVEEVRSEMDRIEKEAIENGKTLAQLLKEKDETATQLEKDIRTDLLVYKMLSEDIEITDDEIDDFISKNPELYKNLGEQEARQRVKKLLLDNEIRNVYDTWTPEANAAGPVN